jgi:XTP/dITP diphosphohydrolase
MAKAIGGRPGNGPARYNRRERRPRTRSPAHLILATRNAGKGKEFDRLLDGLGVTVEDLTRYPAVPEIEETGDSYLANARLKARHVVLHTGFSSLADDSGIEVDALAGEPGVRSARFAAEHASDGDNVALLLQRLSGLPPEQRTARFRCVIVVVRPDGAELVADGSCEGLITTVARGSAGFGYDPVFYFPPAGCTFAELDPAEKNRVSHRARACDRLRARLGAFLRSTPSR